jgi:hypothetical protein
MAQPRAADDFAAIHARVEELRRERLPSPPPQPQPRPLPPRPDHVVAADKSGRHRLPRAIRQKFFRYA